MTDGADEASDHAPVSQVSEGVSADGILRVQHIESPRHG
jgi:hypothetical protein